MFFHKISTDYSRHSLLLLLQILSSHVSLFRSSTTKDRISAEGAFGAYTVFGTTSQTEYNFAY